jgi:hypothetical protein
VEETTNTNWLLKCRSLPRVAFVTFGLVLSGCQTPGAFVGWAALGSHGLETSSRPCRPSPTTAELCRNDENAAELTISPHRIPSQLESWSHDQYRFQLLLRTEKPLGANSTLLVPLLHFSAFKDVVTFIDESNPRVVIAASTNSLGLDLLGSSLMSPRGVGGVILNSGQKEVVEVIARFARTGERVGKVWVSRSKTHLLVESRVEYAVLWTLRNGHNDPTIFILRPRETRWTRLCSGCAQLSDIQFKVEALPSAPQLSYWVTTQEEK